MKRHPLIILIALVLILGVSLLNFGWWNIAIIPLELLIFGVAVIYIRAYKEIASEPGNSKLPGLSRKKEQGIKVNCALHVTYEDAVGNVSERDIQILTYNPNSKHIQARDSIAKASRTFRLDRIIHAVDKQTGELLEINDLHSWILDRKQ